MQLGVSLGIPYTLGKPAAVFSPLDLSPILWLDASDTSTITESGGAVSQWDDKSSNGNNVVQAIALYQPKTGTRTLNGLNAIEFVPTDYIELNPFAISQPVTYFGVFQTDAANNYVIYDHDAGYFWVRNGLGYYRIFSGAQLQGGTPDNNAHVFANTHNSTTSVLRIDGVDIVSGNAGTTAGTRFRLGLGWPGNDPMDGIIAEIVIVSGTLTAGQIAATESYLADKWGITI